MKNSPCQSLLRKKTRRSTITHRYSLIALVISGYSVEGMLLPIEAKAGVPVSSVFKPKASVDRAQFRTPEFMANWGLDLHRFDAAYATNSTGQGVALGQLDSPIYLEHPEFAGVNFNPLGKYPARYEPGPDDYHGNHVAGLMIARKDGKGMHGGAYGVTDFFNGTYRDNNAASRAAGGDEKLADSIIATGTSFVNHSYGTNFKKYAHKMILPDGNVGYYGPDITDFKLGQRREIHESTSAKGIVNVSSAGNDRYYAAYADASNRYDARPRVFRGIAITRGINSLPYSISQESDVDDQRWRQIEKGTVAVVNLNGTKQISSYSNICGVAKYWCVGGAGGMLTEENQAYEVARPDMPLPLDYYIQDATGKKNIYLPLNDPKMSSYYYRMLSVGLRNTAPEGETPKLEPIYRMAMGTSMASPMVTAGMGVAKSRFPYLENWQVRDTVLTTSDDLGAPGVDRVYGWGAMNLEAAMGGPRMLFALRRDYLEKLAQYEKEAADKYNKDVAQADYYATKSYKLRVEIIENELAAVEADKKGDKKEAVRLRAKNETLFPQEKEFRNQAYAHELTRVQPNNPQDTPEEAFEYVNFVVNMPGKVTKECPSEACVADAWTNDISGPGGLELQGAGLLALAGNNTYKGGTKITGGVLQIGTGGTSGSVTGDIINNGSLVFARSDEWVYGNKISGSGNVSVLGGGIWRLTGINSYTGNTSIFKGNLAVDGEIASRADVYAGGVLSGTGRVGGILAKAGGIVSPGNSIGTLAAGTATFEPGSYLDIEVDGQGKHDQLNVQNTAALSGGTVNVFVDTLSQSELVEQVKQSTQKPYEILTAQNGVQGRFDAAGLNRSLPFIEPGLSYTAQQVKLSLQRSKIKFSDVGTNDNQRQIGLGVESTGIGNSLYDTMLTSGSLQEANQSLQQLSGVDVHASVQGSLINDTRFMRDAALARARQNVNGYANQGAVASDALGNNAIGTGADTSVWSRIYGSWKNQSSDGNANQLDRNVGGFLIGADKQLSSKWKVGAVAGYADSSLKGNAGSANVDTYQLGVYASTQQQNLGIRLGANFAHHKIKTSRGGFLASRVSNKARYSAKSMQVYGELGYQIATNWATLEPFINGAYTHLRTGAFEEDGDASTVSGKRRSSNVLSSTLGLRLAHRIENANGTDITISGMVGWNYNAGNIVPKSKLAFSQGDTFSIKGLPIARHAFVSEIGIQAQVKKNLSLGIYYNGQIARKMSDHAVSLNLKYSF